jgi:hypothetical protein
MLPIQFKKTDVFVYRFSAPPEFHDAFNSVILRKDTEIEKPTPLSRGELTIRSLKNAPSIH